MKYMQDFGYKVIPVNPFAEGEVINGETVIRSLDKISEKIDIVDVFRPSKEAPDIAKEAVRKKGKVLWLQYGIHHDEAEKIIDNKKINTFKFLLQKPSKNDVSVNSLTLYYEAFLLLSGRYTADFIRKANHTINVDNTVKNNMR